MTLHSREQDSNPRPTSKERRFFRLSVCRFVIGERPDLPVDSREKIAIWRASERPLLHGGTDGSNLVSSSGESPANLSFRRIEVQGRSRDADGDSRGGEHQGCAAVQQLTASTGIWPDRDIADGWRDIETPCASLPTRSPDTRRCAYFSAAAGRSTGRGISSFMRG